MKKIHIKYAKYHTSGFLLDFIVKSLKITQKDEKFQKTYQRFINEENISVDEYNDMLNTVTEDIVYCFDKNIYSKKHIYYENLIKEFLSFYNLIKLENETLATSQKQLDFINIIDLFIPFVIFSIPHKHKSIIFSILPNESSTTIQELFTLIDNSLKDDLKLKNLLKKELNGKKTVGYHITNQDVDNWFKGNNIPSMKHIELISELYKDTNDFTKNELIIYLQIAKVIQKLYEKSLKYFGENLTTILIEHFKNMDTFYTLFSYQRFDKSRFEKELKTQLKLEEKKYLDYYLDTYYYKNFEIRNYIHSKAIFLDSYIENEHKEVTAFIQENRKYIDSYFKMDEATFFSVLDTILPVKYFKTKLLPNDNLPTEDKQFHIYSIELFEMYKNTLLTSEKTSSSEKLFLEQREKFQEKYEIIDNPYFHFLLARYYAQKRNYKEASEAYLVALENGKNCMGFHIKSIIKEGLYVSAQLVRKNVVDLKNAKSPFTKFYKEAYFYKLIDNLPDDINEYFLNDMKKKFNIYFKYLYPNVKQKENTYITPNHMTIVKKDIRIDYKNPNKLIRKDQPNPITQLMYCCREANFEGVKKLIDNGVDVNILKPHDNASALIFLLDNGVFTNERDKIAKLLILKMSKKTLDTKLVKKQETALSLAIEKGLVDIVKLLIHNGVDLRQKTTLDQFTPLYLTLNFINFSKKESTYDNSNFIVENPLESKSERKKMTTANSSLGGIFDYEKNAILDNLESDLSFKSIEIILEKNYFADLKKKQKQKQYYEIFDLILDATDKVDIANKYNFTPLIFATQLNEVELVKKLLKKGANPDWYTDQDARAFDYAMHNENNKLAQLLE